MMAKFQVYNSGLLLLFSELLLLSISAGWSKKRDIGLKNFSNEKTDPSFRFSFAASNIDASNINDTSWLKYKILYTFTSKKPADTPRSGWTFAVKRFGETTRSKKFQIAVPIRTIKRPEMDAEKFLHLESKSVDLSKILKYTKNATNVSLIKPMTVSINPKVEIFYTSLIKIVTETLNKMINVRTNVESGIPVDSKVLISNMSLCHETDKFNKILLQSLIAEENVPMIQTDVTISLGLKTTTETPSRKFIFLKIDMTEKPIKVYLISKDLELRKLSPSKSYLLGNTKVNRKPKPLSLNQVLTQHGSTMNSTLPICLEFEATLTSINPLIEKLNLILSDSGKRLFQSQKLNNKRGNGSDDITLFRAEKSLYFPTEIITNKTDLTVNQEVTKLSGVEIPLRIVKVKTSEKRTSNMSAEPTTATSYEMIKETAMNTPRLKYQYTTPNISFDSSSRNEMPVGSEIGAQNFSTEKSPAVLSVAVYPKINLRDSVLIDTSPIMAISVARESLFTKLRPLSTDPETTKDIVLNAIESIVDTETIDPELTLNYLMPIKTNFNTSLKLTTISKSVSKPESKIISMLSNHQSTSTMFVQKKLQSTEDRKILQNNGFGTEIAEIGLEKQLSTKLLIPTKFKSTINSAIFGKSLTLTDQQTTSVNVISKDSINDKASSKNPAYVTGKILQNITENVGFKQPVNISELTRDKYLSQRVLSLRPISEKRTAQWRDGNYIAVTVTTSNSSYANVTSRDVFYYAHLNPMYKIANYTTTAVPSRNTEHRTAAVTCRSIATREIAENLGDSNILMLSKSSPYIKDKWTTEEYKPIDVIVPSKKSEHIALAISKEDNYSKKTATSKNIFTSVNKKSEYLGYGNVTLSRDEYSTVNITSEKPNYAITASSEKNEYIITTSKESPYTKGSKCNKSSETAEFEERRVTKIKAISTELADINVMVPSKNEYINSTIKDDYTRLIALFKDEDQTTITVSSDLKYTNETMPFKNKSSKTIPVQSTYPNVTVSAKENEYTIINVTSAQSRYSNAKAPSKDSELTTVITSMKETSFTNGTASSKESKHAVIQSTCSNIEAISNYSKYRMNSTYEPSYTRETATSKNRGAAYESSSAGVRIPLKDDEYTTSKVLHYISMMTSPKQSTFIATFNEPGFTNITTQLKDSKNTTVISTSAKPIFTEVALPKESQHTFDAISMTLYGSVTAISKRKKTSSNVTLEKLCANVTASSKKSRYVTVNVTLNESSYIDVTAPPKEMKLGSTTASEESRYTDTTVSFKESKNTTDYRSSEKSRDTNGTESSKKSKHAIINTVSIQSTYSNAEAISNYNKYRINSTYKPSYTSLKAAPLQEKEYTLKVISKLLSYICVTATSKDGKYTTSATYEPSYSNVRVPSKESGRTHHALPIVSSDTPVTTSSKKGEHSLIIATSKEPTYINITLPFKESNYTLGNGTSEKFSYARVTVPSNRSEYRTIITTSTQQTLAMVRAPCKGTEYSTSYATSKKPGFTCVTISSEESDNRTVTATLKESSYTNGTVSSNKSELTLINTTSVQLACSNITATSKDSKYTVLKTTHEPSYPDLRSPSHESNYTVINTPSVESNISVLTAISKDGEYTIINVTFERSYVSVPSNESKYMVRHATSKLPSYFNVISQLKASKNTTVIATSKEPIYTNVTSSKKSEYTTSHVTCKKPSYSFVTATSGKEHTSFSRYATFYVIFKSSATDDAPRPFKKIGHGKINVISEEPGYNNVTVTSMTSKYSSDPAVWVEDESSTGTITLKEGEGTTGRALSKEGKSEKNERTTEIEKGDYTFKRKYLENEYRKIKMKYKIPSYTNRTLSPATNTSATPIHTTNNIFLKKLIFSSNVSCKDATYNNVMSEQHHYTTSVTPMEPNYTKIISRASKYFDINVTTAENGHLEDKISKKPEYLLKNRTEIKTLSTTNTFKQESYITQTETLKTPSFSVGYLTLQQSYSFTSINGPENTTSRSLHSLEETVRVSTFPPVNTLSIELSSSIALETQNSTVSIVYSETKEMINSGLIAGIVIAIAIVTSLMTSFLIFVVKKRNTNEELEIGNPVYRQKVDV